MGNAWIVDACRTPIGRHGGALAGVRPDDLAAHVVGAITKRVPAIDPVEIDDVFFGDANGAGEDNRNVARMAVLLAGLPTSIPGTTNTRLCGSGMEAVIQASRSIEVGDANVAIGGGVESMSRAPWILPKPDRGYACGDETLFSSTLGWRMVNKAMPKEWTVSLGEGAELLADRYAIGREEQDVFAVASHIKANAAWEAGAFDDEVVLVDGVNLTRDECVRADSTLEKLATLKPAFRPNGTVTAGNASPLNDGSAALILASDDAVARHDLQPLARVIGRAVAAVEPQYFGIGPVEAANKALARAGIGWSDLGAFELNEAFAAQSLACVREWPELDPDILNPLGGAIAIGHPLGCSGARLVTTLAWQLRHRGLRYGLAAMCIGVGQGIAIVLEAA